MIICSALQPNYKLKYQNRQRKRMLYLYNIVYFNSNFEWVFCLSCFHHCTIRRQTGTKMESSTLCIWCVRSSLLELPLSSKHQWCINSWILWKLYSHKEHKICFHLWFRFSVRISWRWGQIIQETIDIWFIYLQINQSRYRNLPSVVLVGYFCVF